MAATLTPAQKAANTRRRNREQAAIEASTFEGSRCTTTMLDGGSTVARVWDSLGDLAADLRDCAANPVNGTQREALSNHAGCIRGFSASWIGRGDVRTIETATAAVNATWDVGMASFDRMMQELESVELPKPISRKRRRRWSEDNGDDVNLDRLRAGQPFWQESHRMARRGPQVITLIAQTGATADVAAEKLIWRGAAMVALSRVLEEQGYRTEIIFGSWGRHCYPEGGRSGDGLKHALTGVRVKGAGDHVNLAAIVNAASAWFHRTITFGCRALEPSTMCSTGYGSTTPFNSKHVDHLVGHDNTKRVLLQDVWSMQAAAQFVKRNVAEIIEAEG